MTPSEAARVLLQRADDAAARRALVGTLLDAIDRGIARVIRNPSKDNERNEIFLGFIDAKILDRRFLQGVADADSAEAFAARASQNYAMDRLRGAQGIRAWSETTDSRAVEKQSGIVVDDMSDDADEEIDELSMKIRGSEAAKRFAALADDQKVMFYVVHAVPPRWVVEHLAQKRQMPVQQVEQEIARRSASHEREAEQLREDLDRRGQEIQRIQYQLLSVRRDRDAKEGRLPIDIAPASPDLVKQMQSRGARRNASLADVLAYERHLVERVETLQRLQCETRQRIHDPEGKTKRWIEILSLLGELPPSRADQAKAINRLTQRYKRLCERLRGGQE